MKGNTPGYFISLEGCEGSGKTTQFNLLAEKLTNLNYDVKLTREPGGTEIGKKIRSILLDFQNANINSKSEILLYAADRAQDIQENIKPALQKGKIVLADRFAASNLVYQGYGRRGDLDMIQKINDWVVGEYYPDLTIILDIDVEIGLARARSISEVKDRLEEEKIEFHHRVREGYRKLAQKKEDQFILVDAECGKQELAQKIFSIIKEHLSL